MHVLKRGGRGDAVDESKREGKSPSGVIKAIL